MSFSQFLRICCWRLTELYTLLCQREVRAWLRLIDGPSPPAFVEVMLRLTTFTNPGTGIAAGVKAFMTFRKRLLLLKYLRQRRAYARQTPFYEIWTREYIANLGDYLVRRLREIDPKRDRSKPYIVLEVGANDGSLRHHLQNYINATHSALWHTPVQLVAVDSGDIAGPLSRRRTPRYLVELLDYKEALALYQPDIVLCSWMMDRQDWTADFRACHSVQEYILIGRVSNTGLPRKSWGELRIPTGAVAELLEVCEEDVRESAEVTPLFDLLSEHLPVPHERDGFAAQTPKDLNEFQFELCKACHPSTRPSITRTFRRNGLPWQPELPFS